MKFIKIVLAVFLLTVPAMAQEQKPEVEMVAMNTVMTHCVAPVFAGDDAARLAEQQKLPEFPAAQAAKFLQGHKGRVFAIPQAPGLIVLKTLDNGICQVAVRELDTGKFWTAMDKAFAPDATPWTLVGNKTENGSTTKQYTAHQNGNIAASIGAREAPLKGGVQALVTIARYKNR